jgi:hypothetical protein
MMTTFLSNRHDVFVAAEDTYGHKPDLASAFQQIRPEADGFSHQGKTTILERKQISGNPYPEPGVVGAPVCEFSLALPARGGGAMTLNGQQASLCGELKTLLLACVSNQAANRGDLCTGGDLQKVELDGGDVTMRFTPGGLVFVDLTGNGMRVGRWISALDNETRTLRIAGDWRGGEAWNWPLIPSPGGLAYAGVQLWGGDDPLDSASIQVAASARDGVSPTWDYAGLVGNLKIEDSSAQQRVLLTFDLKGDGFQRSETQAPLSLEAGALAWPQLPGDLLALAADLRINGAPVAYRSFSLDLGNTYTERLNANAATGRDGYVLTGQSTGGSCVVYWDVDHYGRLAAGEAIDLSWIVGDAGNAVGFHAPRCEIREIKERDLNGLLGMEIQFAVLQSDRADIPSWMLSFMGAAPVV